MEPNRINPDPIVTSIENLTAENESHFSQIPLEILEEVFLSIGESSTQTDLVCHRWHTVINSIENKRIINFFKEGLYLKSNVSTDKITKLLQFWKEFNTKLNNLVDALKYPIPQNDEFENLFTQISNEDIFDTAGLNKIRNIKEAFTKYLKSCWLVEEIPSEYISKEVSEEMSLLSYASTMSGLSKKVKMVCRILHQMYKLGVHPKYETPILFDPLLDNARLVKSYLPNGGKIKHYYSKEEIAICSKNGVFQDPLTRQIINVNNIVDCPEVCQMKKDYIKITGHTFS